MAPSRGPLEASAATTVSGDGCFESRLCAARSIPCRELLQETTVGVVAVESLARSGLGPWMVLGVRALLELDQVPVPNLLVSEDMPPGFADVALELGALRVVVHSHSPVACSGPAHVRHRHPPLEPMQRPDQRQTIYEGSAAGTCGGVARDAWYAAPALVPIPMYGPSHSGSCTGRNRDTEWNRPSTPRLWNRLSTSRLSRSATPMPMASRSRFWPTACCTAFFPSGILISRGFGVSSSSAVRPVASRMRPSNHGSVSAGCGEKS